MARRQRRLAPILDGSVGVECYGCDHSGVYRGERIGSWRIGAAAREERIIKRELQFSPHLFRRTHASVLNKASMKLKAIMEKTRHSNIDVLAKHYIDDNEPATPYFDKVVGV